MRNRIKKLKEKLLEMKKYIITLITVGTFSTSFGQVTINSELKNLINQSFTYFPKIREVEKNVAIAESKVSLTETYNAPNVNAVGNYTYVDPISKVNFGGGDLLFQPNNNVNAAVNGFYNLYDFGKVKANIEKSKDDLQFAKHNVELAKIQLANQVTQIYYNIIYLKKAIIIQDSIISFLNDNKKIVDAKLKDGDALRIDVLNIETQINEEQNRKVDLQNTLDKQYILLQYTTGIKLQTITKFDFDVNLTDANAALSNAQSNNIDFVLAKDRIKQAETDLAIAKLTDKPNVALNAGAGFRNGYQPEIFQFRFNYLAGITLNVPLYTGGKAKQQVKLSENIVKQNQLAVETLNSNYKKDIEQALTDISSNLDRIKNTQNQIDQAKYAQRLAANRFKNGVGTNIELTNTATATARIQLMELRYQFQLCLSRVELAKLMGYTYWK